MLVCSDAWLFSASFIYIKMYSKELNQTFPNYHIRGQIMSYKFIYKLFYIYL